MKNPKKESKRNRLPPMRLKQLEKQVRAPGLPGRLLKAISESTHQFKTGRYES